VAIAIKYLLIGLIPGDWPYSNDNAGQAEVQLRKMDRVVVSGTNKDFMVTFVLIRQAWKAGSCAVAVFSGPMISAKQAASRSTSIWRWAWDIIVQR
jgi:hypothetical protein